MEESIPSVPTLELLDKFTLVGINFAKVVTVENGGVLRVNLVQLDRLHLDILHQVAVPDLVIGKLAHLAARARDVVDLDGGIVQRTQRLLVLAPEMLGTMPDRQYLDFKRPSQALERPGHHGAVCFEEVFAHVFEVDETKREQLTPSWRRLGHHYGELSTDELLAIYPVLDSS